MKQLAAILGLSPRPSSCLTRPPRLLACLPVAFGGVALYGLCPVGSSGSCCQHVPMGAAMLAAVGFLFMGFGSTTAGLEKNFEGLESAAFDVATAGRLALVPGVFAFAFASKAYQPFRKA